MPFLVERADAQGLVFITWKQEHRVWPELSWAMAERSKIEGKGQRVYLKQRTGVGRGARTLGSLCGSLLTTGWKRKRVPVAVEQTPYPYCWWPYLPHFASRMMVCSAAGAALAMQGFCCSTGKGPRPFQCISCSRQLPHLPEPGGEPNSVSFSRCHKNNLFNTKRLLSLISLTDIRCSMALVVLVESQTNDGPITEVQWTVLMKHRRT